jgi:hypothetical protein
LIVRRHYNLPPGDPRILALTEEELTLEVELLHVLGVPEDEPPRELRTCDQCEGQTYRSYCPYCPDSAPLTLLERLVAQEEAGEEVDWNAYDAEVWGQVDRLDQRRADADN